MTATGCETSWTVDLYNSIGSNVTTGPGCYTWSASWATAGVAAVGVLSERPLS